MLFQLLINGVAAGSTYALVALGFSLIYATTRFFNFAHAAVFAYGAYLTWALRAFFGFPVPASIMLGVVLAGLLGAVTELLVYRPLRGRGAGPLVLLMASLGLYVVLQNLLSLGFGDQTRDFYAGQVPAAIPVWGARVTCVQMGAVATTIAVLVVLWVILYRSRLGLMIRATASDAELAATAGISSSATILVAFAVGSLVAGAAGVLVGLDLGMTPTMGMNALLMGVVAMIMGGTGNLLGAAWGGMLLGLMLSLSGWKVGSEWQQVIAFVVLLAFVALRPYGLLGQKLRKAEI